jgi:hypothetical protein
MEDEQGPSDRLMSPIPAISDGMAATNIRISGTMHTASNHRSLIAKAMAKTSAES